MKFKLTLLGAIVLPAALLLSACSGTSQEMQQAGQSMVTNGQQMQTDGQTMMDAGQAMQTNGQGMMDAGQAIQDNRPDSP